MPWTCSGLAENHVAVGALAAPHHRHHRRRVGLRKIVAVDVEPVFVDGVHLRRVEVDAEVAQASVAGRLAPQDQAASRRSSPPTTIPGCCRRRTGRGRTPRSGRRRGRSCAGTGTASSFRSGSAMSRISSFTMPPQLGVGGPRRVAAGDFRRRLEEIAVVEVVVVQLHVGAVSWPGSRSACPSGRRNRTGRAPSACRPASRR